MGNGDRSENLDLLSGVNHQLTDDFRAADGEVTNRLQLFIGRRARGKFLPHHLRLRQHRAEKIVEVVCNTVSQGSHGLEFLSGEGLFLRARLTDGDLIEGIAANDLSLISGEGLFLTPPDIRSNTQRLWIPASSLAELEVVAVIGGAAKKKPVPAKPEDRQESLF